jgi:hypothetical protein
MADLYTDGMGVNPNDNFIVPPYSSKGSNNNKRNDSKDPLGPNNQGGGFSGMPPMCRSLNYSHTVKAYTGKLYCDLLTSTAIMLLLCNK